MAEPSVFPDFSSPFWKRIDPYVLATENLVSKIHAIELLEQLSPYRGASDKFFRRIWRAIDDLQQFSEIKIEWLTAALVLFGNVIYLPQALLEDAWRGLFTELAETECNTDQLQKKGASVWPEMQFFENDPCGMIPAFFHLNELDGRLDHAKYPRVDSTDKLGDTLLDILHPLKSEAAAQTIRNLFEKRIWVLLVDKSLSGHSLGSDIRRLLLAQHLSKTAGYAAPKIAVLCQVLTEAAQHSVTKVIDHCSSALNLESAPVVRIFKAVYLDRSYQIMEPETRLLVDRTLQPNLEELCRWFSTKFLRKNETFARMSARSGDYLEFGYRRCGLTLVDYQNCPTDSLPLLWHTSGEGPQDYRSPYTRIHSRVGDQSIEPSADKWEQIRRSQEIVARLSEIMRMGST